MAFTAVERASADLKKLVETAERVQELLGAVVLTQWVLLTPGSATADGRTRGSRSAVGFGPEWSGAKPAMFMRAT